MTAGPRSAAIIEEEAARWILRREEPDWSPDDDDTLAAWLDESMGHRAAFWRLEHGWREADRVSALGPDRRYPGRRLSRAWSAVTRRAALPAVAAATAAAAAIALVVLPGRWTGAPGPAPAVTAPAAVAGIDSYRTAVGGRRLVALADGSRVELNTGSRLRATSDPQAREAWLDQGEAFFDIVHRPDRRFVVHAGSRTITVLGTRFSVRRQGATVIVAVLSGRVRVDDARVPGGDPSGAGTSGVVGSATVASGNVAVAEPRSTLVAAAGPATVEAMTAWRDGMVVFDRTPLAQAAAEFTRYSPQPIRVADPALADLRVGGTFRTDDSAAFVSLLSRAYGVRVIRTKDAITLDR
jgi:transmembrane sensor